MIAPELFQPRLVQFVRYPSAGECKTRLIPAVGARGAAAIHRHLSEHVFAVLQAAQCPLTVAYTGAEERTFSDWLGGAARYERQADGDLTQKLLPFTKSAPVIFFASDTPELSLAHVEAAIAGLAQHELVIGPALDGGYYLIGMRVPLPQLFTDMPWSTDQVMPQTLARTEKLGIEPHLLEPLADCDCPRDLARWPDLLEQAGVLPRELANG